MSEGHQLVISIVGSLGGFLGALGLYLIKESKGANKAEAKLLENLHFELNYNFMVFQGFKDKLIKAIDEIESNKKMVFVNSDYSYVAHHFSLLFYREGLAAKYLGIDGVKRWNDFLSSLHPGAEAALEAKLEKWRHDSADKEEILQALQFEINLVDDAISVASWLFDSIPFSPRG